MTQAILPAPDPTDPRWAALRGRDAAADGTFVYAVKTTGVFCRPSCPARPARPENVRFFATGAQAEASGYRACLRCRPLAAEGRDPMTGRVEALAAFIRAHTEEAPPRARRPARPESRSRGRAASSPWRPSSAPTPRSPCRWRGWRPRRG